MAELRSLALASDPNLKGYWKLEANLELFGLSLFADSALKGYWRCENNFNDASPSGYNLTNNGSTAFATGQFGQGADFERSSSQSATIANASCPDLETIGDQTFMCWFKPESTGTQQCLMAKVDAGADSGRMLSMNGSGNIFFGSFKSGDDQFVTNTGVVLNTGQWYHIVAVYRTSGQSVTIFVNGVKVTGSFSRAMVADTGSFALGKLGDLTEYADGVIDDAAFFNRALADSEILGIYGLYDASLNGNQLIPFNGPVIQAGKYGNGADFEASSSMYLQAADSSTLSITGDMTICLWLKLESYAASGVEEQGLVGKYATGGNQDFLFLWNDNGDNLQFYLSSDGSSVGFVQAAFTPTLGQWYHVAVVYDASAGSARIYVNGVDIGGGTGLATSIHNGIGPLLIAAYGTPVSFFDGMLDDVAIFNRELTAGELLTLARDAGGAGVLLANLEGF